MQLRTRTHQGRRRGRGTPERSHQPAFRAPAGGSADRSRSAAPASAVDNRTAADTRGPAVSGRGAYLYVPRPRRRCSSRRKLRHPWRMAQRWFAANTGRSSHDSRRSSGFSARTRQSKQAVTTPACAAKVQTPVPANRRMPRSRIRADSPTAPHAAPIAAYTATSRGCAGGRADRSRRVPRERLRRPIDTPTATTAADRRDREGSRRLPRSSRRNASG